MGNKGNAVQTFLIILVVVILSAFGFFYWLKQSAKSEVVREVENKGLTKENKKLKEAPAIKRALKKKQDAKKKANRHETAPEKRLENFLN